MDTGGGSNEDDATTRLLAICDMSISIRRSLDLGVASVENIMEQWDFLQARLRAVSPAECSACCSLQFPREQHTPGRVDSGAPLILRCSDRRPT